MAVIDKMIKKWRDSGLNDMEIRFKIIHSDLFLSDYLKEYPGTDTHKWANELAAIAAFFKEKAFFVKMRAVNSLRKTKDLAIVFVMKEILLNAEDETIRAHAATFFGSNQFTTAPHERPTKDKLEDIKDSMVAILIRALKKEKHIYPLSEIIFALGKFPGKASTRELVKLLRYEGENRDIVRYAIMALGNYTHDIAEQIKSLSDIATEQDLPKNLYGVDNELWEMVVENLEMGHVSPFWNYGAIDRGDLVPDLLWLLNAEEDMDVMFTTLELLGNIKDKRAIPALKAGIHHYRAEGPNYFPEMLESFQQTLDIIMER